MHIFRAIVKDAFARSELASKLVKSIPVRRSSTNTSNFIRLKQRSVVQVKGRDSAKLLQGLLTNDVHCLDNRPVLYSMLLNAQGRVMFDVQISRPEDDTYLLDCEKSLLEELIQHIKKYKLRSKVSFDHRHDLHVYADINGKSDFDPRSSLLGSRIISDFSESSDCDDVYTKHRYDLGISEGAEVLNAIPLEHNIVLLHGVNFSKGCYIGQELLARTHYTGVIRKRVVSLQLSQKHTLENGDAVCDEKGKRVGKLLGVQDNVGIGLMRLKEAFSETKLSIRDTDVQVLPKKSTWWPEDLSP